MKGFCLDVSGDFACFTRPEMKVERVSYDVRRARHLLGHFLEAGDLVAHYENRGDESDSLDKRAAE